MTDNPVAHTFCADLFLEVEAAGLNRTSLSAALTTLRTREGTIGERKGHGTATIHRMFSGGARTVPDLDLVHDILKVVLQQRGADTSLEEQTFADWKRKHARAVTLEDRQARATGRFKPGEQAERTRAESSRTPEPGGGSTAQSAGSLLIDDVLPDKRADHVVLDIRIRNSGTAVVNVTRATVRILDRRKFLAAYHPTADYELLIEGDTSQRSVAHYLKADDVDRFTLTLGFAPGQQGVQFTAEVVLDFNGGESAVSAPFTFDSCFE
ncbi:hypothetical protein ACN24M_39095 [Streptomyces microflavus]|uniref:hypothetical protein n=1 Tax=Streptomyces TaxID=1883 RepID=UPI00397F0810